MRRILSLLLALAVVLSGPTLLTDGGLSGETVVIGERAYEAEVVALHLPGDGNASVPEPAHVAGADPAARERPAAAPPVPPPER